MRSLAAVTLAQGGDRRSSRTLWESLRESADNEWLRNNATFRLAQLDALDAIDQLTAVAAAFRARTGAVPGVLGRAASAPACCPATPFDPGGVPYALDAASGTVTVGRRFAPRAAAGRGPGEPAATPAMSMAYLVVALVGLVIGSFLNVCIYRLPRDQSVVWPASRCTACGREISWYENIPVLSYAVLRGRCRTCGEAISLMYPLIELLTAGVFVATLRRLRPHGAVRGSGRRSAPR